MSGKMSEFLLCKSEYDLKELHCTKLFNHKQNREFLTKVAREYVPIEEQKNLWVLPEIDRYCTEAQKMVNNGMLFQNTKLYHLLQELYDKCTELLLWYGDEYLQLDEVAARDTFFELVEKGIKDSCCEIYAIIKIGRER